MISNSRSGTLSIKASTWPDSKVSLAIIGTKKELNFFNYLFYNNALKSWELKDKFDLQDKKRKSCNMLINPLYEIGNSIKILNKINLSNVKQKGETFLTNIKGKTLYGMLYRDSGVLDHVNRCWSINLNKKEW